MKKNIITLACIIAAAISPLNSLAQLQRSDAFHQKYKLKSVAIFSRHNVRAPITDGSSLLGNMTTHKWIAWTTSQSQLTMKGGMLEAANGEFFHQWVVSEGLFSDNDTPTSDEVLIYANSKQRTIATARFFLSGFMPMSDLTVTWNGDLSKADPLFNGSFYNVTQEMQDELQKEIVEKYGVDGLKKLSESGAEGLKLIQDILDLKNSSAYQEGKVSDFGDNPDHDMKIVFKEGDEPQTSGSIKDAANASDALTLQYYQDPDSLEAYFGHQLTMEQRRAIFHIKDMENGTRWTIPCIYKPLAQNFLNTIASELENPDRKFYFMCGHDSNIFCILSALDPEDYERVNAVEEHVPIGSKIVFEKWADDSGNEYIAVNHVYQSIDQVRNISVLTQDNPPVIIPLNLKQVKANDDGLYAFDDFMNFIKNINTPTSVSNVKADAETSSAKFNVAGQRLTDEENVRGIVISNGIKSVK